MRLMDWIIVKKSFSIQPTIVSTGEKYGEILDIRVFYSCSDFSFQ